MPEFFIGFDLVGQEDLGRPLLDFADQLIEARNRTGLKYFFHAGETNWQGKEYRDIFKDIPYIINTTPLYELVYHYINTKLNDKVCLLMSI